MNPRITDEQAAVVDIFVSVRRLFLKSLLFKLRVKVIVYI
jgi:hypothetical protein